MERYAGMTDEHVEIGEGSQSGSSRNKGKVDITYYDTYKECPACACLSLVRFL